MSGQMRGSRITEKAQFDELFSHGKRIHTPFYVFIYQESSSQKVAFIASKKVGNAVNRNKAKRRLKELYRLNQKNFEQVTCIWIAKKTILNCGWDELTDTLVSLKGLASL